MPVTFGAVGDIISVCLLVKDLVEALDKSRGSKAEYQSLIRELWILDRSLLEIDLLTRTHGGGATPELEALCNTARKAVDHCKKLVNAFSTRLQKYQKDLGGKETPIVIKATAMKVRWCIGEKDAVEKFRVEIAATSTSLQMLLATASVKLMEVKARTMEARVTTVQQENQTNFDKQSAILISVKEGLQNANRQIAAGNLVTSKISDALRLDWLRQLGAELKGYMCRIIAMNIATYHAVLSIQSALPCRLERSLIEDPFILEDAIGRIAPVHLQFVTSWEAFHAVLEIRFRELQGFKKIQMKQYGLQERASKRDIELSRPWQRAFLPGQRIEMSILFDTDDNMDSKSAVSCPGCQTPSVNSSDAEIQCESCKMWFRRITIVQDVEPLAQNPMSWPCRSEFESSEPASTATAPVLASIPVNDQARPQRKRVTSTNVDDEDDLRVFKRVRLIMRKGPSKSKTSKVIQRIGQHEALVCGYIGCIHEAFPYQKQVSLDPDTVIHHPDRPYYCPAPGCPRSEGVNGFTTKENMIYHQLVHTTPGFVCPFCPGLEHKFPRRDRLQQHVRDHHADKNKDDLLLRDAFANRRQTVQEQQYCGKPHRSL